MNNNIDLVNYLSDRLINLGNSFLSKLESVQSMLKKIQISKII